MRENPPPPPATRGRRRVDHERSGGARTGRAACVSPVVDRETLADYLRLSTDTIDRLVRASKLACVRIGSQVRFTLEDVEAFLERNRTDSAAAR